MMTPTTASMRLLPWIVPVLLGAGAASPSGAQSAPPAGDAALPRLSELAEGWNRLQPGGETTCAHGTPYEFYVRPADPDRLLVFLYGGGGCWDAETCDPDRRDTYVATIEPARHPARLSGIFELDHPENPVAGHSMVAVPVCTGDAFLGDRDATYTLDTGAGEPRQFTIRHRGQTNTLAVHRWIQANFTEPREIVVAGSSAGAVGMAFHASLLARHYPSARVVGLGDDAGSFGSAALPGADPGRWGLPEVLRRHGGWEEIQPAGGITELYITAARSAPNLRLYQFDHAHDGTQRFYHQLAGAQDTDVLRHLRANRRAIRDRVSEFHSFTAGGYAHTILVRENFYQYQTDGHRLRDWFAAIVSGEPVASVECVDDCRRPGLVYGEHDLRVVERSLELLSAPGAWDPRDSGPCPAQAERYSLRCATAQAAREVTGRTPAGSRNIPSALWDVVYTATERLGDQGVGDAIVRYNNHPDTTAAEVIGLLEEVRERIRLARPPG